LPESSGESQVSGGNKGCSFSVLVSEPPTAEPIARESRSAERGACLKEKDTNMNGPARTSALAIALAGMVLSISGCNQLEARNELNHGVEAYKSQRYEEAIGHFQKATQLDPNLPMAKTYLATALAVNVVPGLDTPENIKAANQAIAIFEEVLAKDPNDVNSLKQIGGIYYSIASPTNPDQQRKNLENAKAWQKKVLAVDPKDPEAAYWIGMIDFTEAHQNILKVLGPAGITDDGAGNAKAPKKVMDPIKAENGPLVAEGLQYLNQAVANRSNYDDAMAYLNLLYRRKADVDYGDETARKEDVAMADEWRTKAMGTRKANEAKKNAEPGGITMDSNGNMK